MKQRIMLLKIALLAVLRQKKSATKNDNNPGTEKKRERSEEVIAIWGFTGI